MEIVNLEQIRRFLNERPIRVNVFDRSRVVTELVCLEPGQDDERRMHSASDELYVVLDGRARLRAGAQVAELNTRDAVVVPMGVDHFIHNPGPERLVLLATVAPKPARASEVRLPSDERQREDPRGGFRDRERRSFRPLDRPARAGGERREGDRDEGARRRFDDRGGDRGSRPAFGGAPRGPAFNDRGPRNERRSQDDNDRDERPRRFDDRGRGPAFGGRPDGTRRPAPFGNRGPRDSRGPREGADRDERPRGLDDRGDRPQRPGSGGPRGAAAGRPMGPRRPAPFANRGPRPDGGPRERGDERPRRERDEGPGPNWRPRPPRGIAPSGRGAREGGAPRRYDGRGPGEASRGTGPSRGPRPESGAPRRGPGGPPRGGRPGGFNRPPGANRSGRPGPGRSGPRT